MNEEVKQKWISALKSGEYEQGLCSLRNQRGWINASRKGEKDVKCYDSFCCLGVLCDLYSKEFNIEWEGFSFLSNKNFLPLEVMKWADLPYDRPRINEDNNETLDQLNDKGTSFGDIANLIEKHL